MPAQWWPWSRGNFSYSGYHGQAYLWPMDHQSQSGARVSRWGWDFLQLQQPAQR